LSSGKVIDVDQLPRCPHVELHLIDQVRATGQKSDLRISRGQLNSLFGLCGGGVAETDACKLR